LPIGAVDSAGLDTLPVAGPIDDVLHGPCRIALRSTAAAVDGVSVGAGPGPPAREPPGIVPALDPASVPGPAWGGMDTCKAGDGPLPKAAP
jgi:hypothetical protein